MILGDVCTRDCRFCAVKSGQPEALDVEEPDNVAEAARRLNLRHVVITSVTRDDLQDGGAEQFVRVIKALKRELPSASIEVLTPDFRGSEDSLATVLNAKPEVFNHNVETVHRLQKGVRPQASYTGSLEVLRWASGHTNEVIIKSGLMLGLGETDDEVLETMHDMRTAGCTLLTIGQYLCPGKGYASVERYVTPEEFEHYRVQGEAMGFMAVASAPLARSSYKAEEMYACAVTIRKKRVHGSA